MRRARVSRVIATGLALSSALGLAVRADTLLLSDSFTANNTDASTFNNTLAADQAGTVATVSYSLAGYDAGWQIQHGNGGEMLLAAGWSGYARDLYASLNRNFAPDANAADKPLKIQFFLKVIDASDPSNWATFAVGSAQNAFVVAGANKFSSLFRRNGGTQQFASGGDISTGATFNPAGSTITLILSDTAGTGSPFDGGGSVARFYIDGALAGTFTLAQMSSSDGYLNFEANGAFGVYDNLSVSLLNSIAWNTPAAITADANVATNGMLLYAYTQSGAGATVNGVPFAAGNSTTSLGGGNVTLAGFDAVDASTYIGANPVGLSSAYQIVVQGGAYNGGSAATVTLNNLVSGHTYLVQFWVCDYRQWPPAVIARSETLTSVATSGALTYLQTDGSGNNVGVGSGSYVTGTFTADSTSQTITVTPNASAQINAIQVRELMSFTGVQASETTSHLINARTGRTTSAAPARSTAPTTGGACTGAAARATGSTCTSTCPRWPAGRTWRRPSSRCRTPTRPGAVGWMVPSWPRPTGHGRRVAGRASRGPPRWAARSMRAGPTATALRSAGASAARRCRPWWTTRPPTTESP